MRISIHVHPGSKHPRVGGSHGSSLIVRVRSRAVEGAATAEVVRSLAKAFNVPSNAVTVVRGTTSRDKIVDIEGDGEGLHQRLDGLLLLDTTTPSKER